MSSRPNILFLLTDDQRFDTIAALGNDAIPTPAMDRLIRQGTTFTHAHIMGGTVAAVCMPSRAMIMTGRSLFSLHDNGGSIPDDHELLGETLRKAGYKTHGIGKWHNGRAAFARSFTGGDEIFFGGMEDHWNVPAYRYDPSGRYDATLPVCHDAFHSNEVTHRHGDHIHAGRHSSEVFADAAVSFLDDPTDDAAPFFLYVAFMAPHDPRSMPQAYRTMVDPESIELPPNFSGGHPFDNGELHVRDEMLAGFPRDPDEVRTHIAEYHAMIAHLDAQIGRILDALDRSGQADNTIVILAGDNGLAVGQHGLMGKQNLYDHSTRVPLVMAGPGIAQDARCGGLCYLLDIYPTLCELLSLDVPASVEGRTLAAALAEARAPLRDDLLLAYGDLQRAVTDGRWKLIEYLVDNRRTTQLFDLLSDPWECHDLSRDPALATTVSELRKRLAVLCRDVGDPSNVSPSSLQ